MIETITTLFLCLLAGLMCLLTGFGIMLAIIELRKCK